MKEMNEKTCSQADSAMTLLTSNLGRAVQQEFSLRVPTAFDLSSDAMEQSISI